MPPGAAMPSPLSSSHYSPHKSIEPVCRLPRPLRTAPSIDAPSVFLLPLGQAQAGYLMVPASRFGGGSISLPVSQQALGGSASPCSPPPSAPFTLISHPLPPPPSLLGQIKAPPSCTMAGTPRKLGPAAHIPPALLAKHDGDTQVGGELGVSIGQEGVGKEGRDSKNE